MISMKDFIHWHLTLLRDKSWLPRFVVRIIDHIRYELIDTYER
jgi:hypothetical protein